MTSRLEFRTVNATACMSCQCNWDLAAQPRPGRGHLEPCWPLTSKVWPLISLYPDIKLNQRCNFRYRSSENDLRYRLGYDNSKSNVETFDIECLNSEERRYLRLQPSISAQNDIQETSILKVKTSILKSPNIEEIYRFWRMHLQYLSGISKFWSSVLMFVSFNIGVSFSDPAWAAIAPTRR